MKNHIGISIVLCLFFLTTLGLFGDDLGTSHSCETFLNTTDTDLEFTFTVPNGAGIGKVTIDFTIENTSEVNLITDDIQVTLTDPFDDPIIFSGWYIAGQNEYSSSIGDEAYKARLRPPTSSDPLLEIVKVTEGTDTWDTDTRLDTWTVKVTGLTVNYDFELVPGIKAYEEDGTTLVDPQPSNFQITGIDPCNQAPTASFTLNSPGNSDFLQDSADEDLYYAIAPVKVNLNGTDSQDNDLPIPDPVEGVSTYTWGLDNPQDSDSMTTGTPWAVYDQPGEYTISLQVVDNEGISSTNKIKTLKVLSNEKVAYPRSIGLPRDTQKWPIVDGALEGDDDEPNAMDGSPFQGIVYGENGWRGAYKIEYSGGTDTDVMFEAIKHRNDSENKIYLAFDIDDFDELSPSDEIMLGFRGTSDHMLSNIISESGTDRLLYIRPNAIGLDNKLKIRKRTADVWETVSVAPNFFEDNGFDVGIKDDYSESDKWSIEIQVPTAAIGTEWPELTDNGLFFYIASIKDDSASDPKPCMQYFWPRGAESFFWSECELVDSIENHDYSTYYFGRADLSGTSSIRGVALDSYSLIGNVNNSAVETITDPVNVVESTTLYSNIKYHDPEVTLPNAYKNILVAKVRNDGYTQEWDDITETFKFRLKKAENVYVTFKKADWGLPSAERWGLIEPENNSGLAQYPPEDETYNSIDLSPRKNIPEADPPLLDDLPEEEWGMFTLSWVLTNLEVQEYRSDDPDNITEAHQCIYVEVYSDSDTDIVTKSVHRNMNFNAANAESIAFSARAVIDALGYGIPPNNQDEHTFLLKIDTKEWAIRRPDLDPIYTEQRSADLDAKLKRLLVKMPYLYELIPYIEEEENVTSFLEYIVNGYRFTGVKLIVDEEEFEVADPIGSYGHVVRHEGPVEEWRFEITGDGVDKIDERTYTLKIAPDETEMVTDNVKAFEPPKWRTYVQGGAAFPLSTLGTTNRIGPNFIVGAGYHLIPAISLNILFGYNFLPAAAGGPGTHLMSTSLNGRFYKALGRKLSVFAGLGPGFYFDNAGRSEFGVNGGLGLSLRLIRHLALEAGVDYHVMFTSASQYIHAHAGVTLRF